MNPIQFAEKSGIAPVSIPLFILSCAISKVENTSTSQKRKSVQESAANDFHRAFPNGGLTWCDFRPHFDGFLVNAWCAIAPLADEVETRAEALDTLTQIALWLRANAASFETGDMIQLIVGFPESVKTSSRQIFKCSVPAARLVELRGVGFDSVGGLFREMEGWSDGLNWPGGEFSS